MTALLNEVLTPEQVRDRLVANPAVASVLGEFNESDREALEGLLTEPQDYVKDPAFTKAGAERRLMDQAPAIRKPDTSWYHPVMDNLRNAKVMKNVGTVLLTAAEEKVIFLQYNYCRCRVAKLQDKLNRKDRSFDTATAREMLSWHRKAEALREQIAQTNLALVLAMAKRTRMNEVDFGDLVSEGNMALLRAVDKFDVARGFKFSTYACRAILKAFSRSGVKLSKYRQLFPTDFDPKLEKSDYMDRKREDDEAGCVEEVRRILQQNKAELTQIEQEVIEHRFNIGNKRPDDTGNDPLTLEQVGRIIGVTKERVRQIQNKALEKIRLSLERDFLR